MPRKPKALPGLMISSVFCLAVFAIVVAVSVDALSQGNQGSVVSPFDDARVALDENLYTRAAVAASEALATLSPDDKERLFEGLLLQALIEYRRLEGYSEPVLQQNVDPKIRNAVMMCLACDPLTHISSEPSEFKSRVVSLRNELLPHDAVQVQLAGEDETDPGETRSKEISIPIPPRPQESSIQIDTLVILPIIEGRKGDRVELAKFDRKILDEVNVPLSDLILKWLTEDLKAPLKDHVDAIVALSDRPVLPIDYEKEYRKKFLKGKAKDEQPLPEIAYRSAFMGSALSLGVMLSSNSKVGGDNSITTRFELTGTKTEAVYSNVLARGLEIKKSERHKGFREAVYDLSVKIADNIKSAIKDTAGADLGAWRRCAELIENAEFELGQGEIVSAVQEYWKALYLTTPRAMSGTSDAWISLDDSIFSMMLATLDGMDGQAGIAGEAHYAFDEAMREHGSMSSRADTARVADAFIGVILKAPWWTQAHYHLGTLLYDRGDHRQAARCLGRCILTSNARDEVMRQPEE